MSEVERLVIVDTDPGIDDAMALLFLQAQAGVRIHSLTTVFGNGDVATTTRNALFLADRLGLDVPVHAGAAEALAGGRHVPDLKVHGEDGLGGMAPHEAGALPEGSAAWRHIIEVVRCHPGAVTLLAIGPLTNLALALRADPGIAELVREVVVMGGAFGTAGRHGNITPHAEANFFYDPEAADFVLSAGWPVTVVGLDVTTECILPTVEAARLREEGGDIGRLLWEMSREYESIYRKFDGIDGCCIHDVAAAAYVAHPEWFKRETAPLGVELTGTRRGASTVMPASARPGQHFCTAVEDARVLEGYAQAVLKR